MRIAILGAECTGKTTVARALGERLPATVVPEALRLFVERKGRVPSGVEEMFAIAREQRRLEDEALAEHAVVVCDTTPLLVQVYAEHYFGRVDADFEAFVDACDYDVVALAEDDIPWVADGLQRDGEAVREAVQQRLRGELSRRGLNVISLRGTLSVRAERLVAVLGSR